MNRDGVPMLKRFAQEVCSPLNTAMQQLDAACQRLTHSPAQPKQARLAIDLAMRELQRVATLMEEFVLLAQTRALHLERVDLHKFVEGIVVCLQPWANSSEVALEVTASGPLSVDIDSGLFEQVILSLLRNAVEASRPGGQVHVSITRDSAGARVSVEDSGVGFSRDAAIFTPFYTTKTKGTGLSLAVAQRIVAHHAGSLEATSEAGRTVFSVTLPAADSQPSRVSLSVQETLLDAAR